MPKAITSKESNCSGCSTCSLVCSMHLLGEVNPKKTAIRISGEFPVPGKFAARVCTQCGECAEVCPVGCIRENSDGILTVNEEECIGCMNCVETCPEKIMVVDELQGKPLKCDLCGQCISNCYTNALALSS